MKYWMRRLWLRAKIAWCRVQIGWNVAVKRCLEWALRMLPGEG